ncbi:hypothetical protein A5787_13500 [Mycobacterium sp. 852002-50816_SCH5313054-b]|uniref:hypothetical protein n=1 Tax=Mycobacterium sp. 852002-50816_SCH5313054-b TaxID=1834092 RepID=UPI0008012685|nr:hypothetical protein [Mycobacterium sp. 852002-50816_SCH5313054-b]OBF44465.1 hypothetical protein A5787_13500 [Mycobacterium sp. 852002-50816_SCH5313054-b]
MTVWETAPHVEYLAHHMLLLAIPAFLPAVLVVAVILYVALKDRRNGGKAQQPAPRGDEADQKGD